MNYTTYIANQNVRSSPSVINPPVHTLISFDAGGNWEKLRPPSQDSNGNDIQCLQVINNLASVVLKYFLLNSSHLAHYISIWTTVNIDVLEFIRKIQLLV